jgi:hypothetical protein
MNRAQGILTNAAAAVIVVLTIAAFWLSYAHLHQVAAGHGLSMSPERAWAWPATLDLFIVAGELLMLRGSLARSTDWWAVALTVVGSTGSIALNVLGVSGGDPLDYVVAAVPPTAALLAFGALMRQVHGLLGVHAVPVDAVDAQPVRSADAEFLVTKKYGESPAPEPVPAAQPATAPAASRPRPHPAAAKVARPVRTDDELLAHLTELRTGAHEPLTQRFVLAQLGVGVPRLRTLLDTHSITLDPLPAGRVLRAVDNGQPDLAAAGGGV